MGWLLQKAERAMDSPKNIPPPGVSLNVGVRIYPWIFGVDDQDSREGKSKGWHEKEDKAKPTGMANEDVS